MLIHVTTEDIERGETVDCERCPVALALNRALYPFRVEVGETVATVYDGDKFVDWNLPARVTDFIREFDVLVDVEPFSFELPDSVMERLKS